MQCMVSVKGEASQVPTRLQMKYCILISLTIFLGRILSLMLRMYADCDTMDHISFLHKGSLFCLS